MEGEALERQRRVHPAPVSGGCQSGGVVSRYHLTNQRILTKAKKKLKNIDKDKDKDGGGKVLKIK